MCKEGYPGAFSLNYYFNYFHLLGHPWIMDDRVAPDKPLDSAVLSRLKQFAAMNKLKKMALRVCFLKFFVFFSKLQVDLMIGTQKSTYQHKF